MKNIVEYSEFNEKWNITRIVSPKDRLAEAVNKIIDRLKLSKIDNPYLMYGESNKGYRYNRGIFYSTIVDDRVDLAKKLLDAFSEERAIEMVSMCYDELGYKMGFMKNMSNWKQPLDIAKSDKMRMLLIEYLPKDQIKLMFSREDSFNVMKSINNFEEHNESWRQVKGWMNIPGHIIDTILGNIFHYASNINLLYKQLSARVDIGKSVPPVGNTTIKTDPVKLSLNDMRLGKLKYNLLRSNFLSKWNIYYIRNTGNKTSQDSNKDVIYITKDELKKGDVVHGDRLHDSDISNKPKKDLGHMVIVVAKITNRHEEMSLEREIRVKKKLNKELDIGLKKIIKLKNDHNGKYFNNEYGIFNKITKLFYKSVKADRYDIVKKIFDIFPKDANNLSNARYDFMGIITGSPNSGNTPLELAKSDKMKSVLLPHLHKETIKKMFSREDSFDVMKSINQ